MTTMLGQEQATLAEPRATNWRGEAVVYGPPQGQGSKRIVTAGGKTGGRPILIESGHKSRPWRSEMVASMRASRPPVPFDAPMWIDLAVYVNRPRSHYGTGRNSGVLKPGAPARPKAGLDLDKCLRAVQDAATAAGWVTDDSRFVEGQFARHYAGPGGEGVYVQAGLIR